MIEVWIKYTDNKVVIESKHSTKDDIAFHMEGSNYLVFAIAKRLMNESVQDAIRETITDKDRIFHLLIDDFKLEPTLLF